MISEKFPMQLANLARTVVRRAMTLYKIDIAKCGIGGEIRQISLSEIRLSNLLLFAVVLCVFSQGQVLPPCGYQRENLNFDLFSVHPIRRNKKGYCL